MDKSGKDKDDHTGLKQNNQMHLWAFKGFNKHKLIEKHSSDQYAFNNRIKDMQGKYFLFIYF